LGKDILGAPSQPKPHNSIEITDGLPKLLNSLRQAARTEPENLRFGPEVFQDVSKLVRVKCDRVFAAGTDNIVVTLEPTELLIEIVPATGAVQRESYSVGEL